MFTNIYNNLQTILIFNLFNHKFFYFLFIRKLLPIIKPNHNPN